VEWVFVEIQPHLVPASQCDIQAATPAAAHIDFWNYGVHKIGTQELQLVCKRSGRNLETQSPHARFYLRPLSRCQGPVWNGLLSDDARSEEKAPDYKTARKIDTVQSHVEGYFALT
jgi:hypothetical protein